MARPLDTNVIIRDLTQDTPALSQQAHAFLQRVERGEETVRLTEGVLVEAVQVLSSKTLYNRPRAEIRDRLTGIIELDGIQLPDKPRYIRALAIYASTPALDFVDALLVVYAEEESPAEVVSFDQDFDPVPGITRRQPDAHGQLS
jgi:predicted nucleic acid-binding protein